MTAKEAFASVNGLKGTFGAEKYQI